MTREEAIKITETAKGANGYIMDGWEDAIEMALNALVREANRPDPQGLDEAAEDFCNKEAARMYDYEGKTEEEIVEAAFKAGVEWRNKQTIMDELLQDILNLKVYLKIPMTTHYSGDISEFDECKTHIVEGTEFCEKDKFGDSVCCWYVSTIFGAVKNFEWLISEIAECGCIPTIQERSKGLFV